MLAPIIDDDFCLCPSIKAFVEVIASVTNISCIRQVTLNSMPAFILRRDVAVLWRVNVIVTHVVVEALGMVTKNFRRRLQQREVSVRTEFLQKAALLGTTRILRKVLEA